MNKALLKAVDIAGGQTRLAEKISKACGVKLKQSHIHTWINRNKKGIPAQYCPAAEKITGVPKELLRPDVYQSVRQ